MLLGIADGEAVGATDGDILVLGALLGAGLLLGTVLGRSVGHDSLVGVVAKSLQILMWVTAEGPCNLTISLDTDGTSTTTCRLGSEETEGSTTKERVAPSASVTCRTALSTTFISPISTSSSTGVINSNTRTPPASFAFHWAFPPVCCTTSTLPASPARPGVPYPSWSTGADVSKRRGYPLGMNPPVPSANSSAESRRPYSFHCIDT